MRHVLPGRVLKVNERTVRLLCPFHDERTPSLVAWRASGRFYCFGCQRTGDVVVFVSAVMGLALEDVPKCIATALAAAAPEQLALPLVFKQPVTLTLTLTRGGAGGAA